MQKINNFFLDGKFVQLKMNPIGIELKTSQLMEWWIKAYLNGFGRTLVGRIDKDGLIIYISSNFKSL